MFEVMGEGLVEGARQAASPNCNQRPDLSDVSLLVLHNISLPPGQFGGTQVEEFFSNGLDHSKHPFFREIEGVKVSAHLFVRRDGEVVQFVSLELRAWHAGVSCFEGREGCNDFSIGIELEGTDSLAYTEEQYHALARVTRAIQKRYPAITADRIVGHCDIAPGRKTDPGDSFEWDRFRAML